MTGPHRLNVPLGERAYELLVEPGMLDRAGEWIAPLLRGPRLIVVTDAQLRATPHPDRLERALQRVGLRAETMEVPPGEGSKSFTALAALCDAILARGIDRRTTVVALGGGVVGDLAGFAAAILLRGLDLIQIPTTLLAQVDSSAGGKTGINSPHGKNLVGAFHQPKLVLIDPTALATLPPRELRAGYAELVKHAFIRDAALHDWLEEHLEAVLGGDVERQAEAIARSVAVKVAIVGADERETSGERALLNFGHTFAHAYETLDGYSDRLRHGEAVAIGMADAFRLSIRLGCCPGQDATRAVRHLARAGLPTSLGERDLHFDPVAIRQAMAKDKKAMDGRLTFIVSEGIGHARLAQDVPAGELEAVLRSAGRTAA